MNFNKTEYLASFGTAEQLKESDKPEIVFSGRSNVGKSSLINKIFTRKNLARVSSTPGKTITINFFAGDGANFVDLPGYGYAKREISEKKRWASLMESYFTCGRNIALVVQLIDFRHKPSEDDYTMLSFLEQYKIPYIIVFTKCDKLNKAETEKRRQEIAQELKDYDRVKIEFSALSGIGVNEVREQIEIAVTR